MNFSILIKPCMFRTQSRPECCSIAIVFAYFRKQFSWVQSYLKETSSPGVQFCSQLRRLII